MINLLPDEYKKTIHREHQLRLLTTYAFFFCCLASISLVLFFPSYVLTRVRIQEAQAESNAAMALVGEQHDVGAMVNNLSRAARVARELGTGLSAPRVHGLLTVLDRKPSGIRVTEISVTSPSRSAADAPSSELVLRGTARSRESLTAFNKFLSAQPQFSRVDIPISNFAKERNFEFTARITLTP